VAGARSQAADSGAAARSDARTAASERDAAMIGGIFGRPFVNLEPHLDVGALAALDDEISLGLTEVAIGYTGGSHKSMGIVPRSCLNDAYVDYGHVIARMSRSEFVRFASLSDTPAAFDVDRRDHYQFGEERDWPLSRRQMLYLEYRHGVYFPWKVYYELMPNLAWEERADDDGKAFTEEARRVFPRTVAFIERLPFASLGRCNLLGLQSNDHGTIHRDGEDEEQVGHFITLCPRADKRLFLWDEDERTSLPVEGRAYWFDDRNYHGVAADPFFRYSLRVDGVFDPAFLSQLQGELNGGG
jgi:hypothetical protein